MRNLTPFKSIQNDPFDVFNDFDRDMRRFFDMMDTRMPLRNFHERDSLRPAYDVTDKESHMLLSFDLPGISQKDIKIDVSDGNLHISGERKTERENTNYRERSYGRFDRTISLPSNVSTENVEAHYEDGVLSIALPKTVDKKAKEVQISQGRKEGIWNRLLAPKKKVEETTKEHQSKVA